MPYKTVNMPVGSSFGRLVTTAPPVLRARSDGRNRSWVTVRCTCGTTKDVLAGNLLSGRTHSCGCYHRDRASEANTTHGATHDGKRTRLYRIWRGMRSRCLDENATNYAWYGAKGVSFCAEWNSFPAFQEWATGAGYADGLELDRVDSEDDYRPDNCRWVTKKQNIRNRDRFWDDELDQRLVDLAAKRGVSPYQLLKDSLVAYLEQYEEVSL